jgi:hypothetical protein
VSDYCALYLNYRRRWLIKKEKPEKKKRKKEEKEER